MTTRVGLCGICGAIEFGMTDSQVDRALEVLTNPRGGGWKKTGEFDGR